MNRQECARWIHHAALEISGLQADQGRPGVPEFSIETVEKIIADQFRESDELASAYNEGMTKGYEIAKAEFK